MWGDNREMQRGDHTTTVARNQLGGISKWPRQPRPAERTVPLARGDTSRGRANQSIRPMRIIVGFPAGGGADITAAGLPPAAEGRGLGSLPAGGITCWSTDFP
jgi:hypothetical protein